MVELTSEEKMSRPRDRLHFVSTELEDEADLRAVETNNTLMYGIVLLIASIGIVLSFVIWIV